MSKSILQRLAILFERLPGIGPRQAWRFVYHLADENKENLKELIELLSRLGSVKSCQNCFRVFEADSESRISDKCRICKNQDRDHSVLLILEKDLDFQAVEKSKNYSGLYFILGGVMSPLNSEKVKSLRLKELFERIKNSKEIKEIILGLSATVEGEITSRYIEKILEPAQKEHDFKISRLARGLTTGAELEYMDGETIKNSLLNRK